MKTFNTSPLPFQGQKRNFVKHFKIALQDYEPTGIYVDLFGGSGLLSHTVKSVYPFARVIYNDFDNFGQRIKQIPETNKLLSQMRDILKNHERKKQIIEPLRSKITEMLHHAHAEGYNDWITVSSNLLFSMNYATSLDGLIKETFYNKVCLSDYEATGYLKGVEVVCLDYKYLFSQLKE